MAGQGEQPAKKTAEEITREAEAEITRAAQLAREAHKGKRHHNR
jgi:hypothetical protein